MDSPGGAPAGVIEIAWLDASLDDADWPRGYPDVLHRLSLARANGPRCRVTEHDIVAWDWTAQAITLSAESTRRVIDSLPTDGELSDTVREMMRMHAGLGWGSAIGLRLHTRGFLVSLNGQPLYGGVCLEPASERAVGWPVLRSSIADGRAVFHVLPVHLPFLLVDPGGPTREITPDMIAPEARADWPMPAVIARHAYGEVAARFAHVLRDSRLHDAVKACGIGTT